MQRRVRDVVRGRELHVHGDIVSVKRATLAAIAGVLVASVANAQVNRDAARAAYEAGTQAYRQGDFAKAAARYAEADTLAPSAVALQAALDAAVKADDAVIGAELLDRARTRTATGALQSAIDAAAVKLAHRAGKLTVTCPGACTATLDGSVVELNHVRWVTVGTHVLSFLVDARSSSRSVDVPADAEISVSPPEPPVVYSPSPPLTVPTTWVTHDTPLRDVEVRHRSRGMAPAWFWGSLGATVALGVASGILLGMTSSTHGSFVAQSCSTSTTASCASLASQGSATETAGDILLAGSIVATIWTVIAGAALVRWSGAIGVSPSTHGAAGFWRVVF